MKKIVAIAGAAALVLGGSVAYAAIPDSDDGEFHACMRNSPNSHGDEQDEFDTHRVELQDSQAGKVCPSGWTAKVWNQGSGDPGFTGIRLVRVTQEAPCVFNEDNQPLGTRTVVDAPSGTRISDAGTTVIDGVRTHVGGDDVGFQYQTDLQGLVSGVSVSVAPESGGAPCPGEAGTGSRTATVDLMVYDI